MPSLRWNAGGLLNALGDPHGPPPVVIRPGLNQVSAAELAALKAHPTIRHYEGLGMLEFLDAELPAVLRNLDVHAAKMVVGETVNPETLGVWLKAEKRKPVRVAISRQLAAIDPKKEQPDPVPAHFPVPREDTAVDLGHYGPQDVHSPRAKRVHE
jgi:hypothetical protein